MEQVSIVAGKLESPNTGREGLLKKSFNFHECEIKNNRLKETVLPAHINSSVLKGYSDFNLLASK